jgi:hypothetical protein
MKPIPWYYIFSPKYEIFHHILSSSIGPTNDFIVKPIFLPQEAFSNTYSVSGKHFFAGNVLKIDSMIKALEHHPGEHVIVSDVDIIANHTSLLRKYLEDYKENDMTFSRDTIETNSNIGFAFIKSTPETIAFFKTVYDIIKKTNGQDQIIVNELLPTFSGRHGFYKFDKITQTNKHILKDQYYILQLLCSNTETYEKNLFEKLVSVVKVLDITDLLHLIPDDVLETLRWYFGQNYPDHYISKL